MEQKSRRTETVEHIRSAIASHAPAQIHDPLEKVGDAVDAAISRGIERHFEAPLLDGVPEPYTWYRITIPDGIAGDGSGYYIYIKTANSDHLCVFLSGGGVAWNGYMAARPVTGGKVAAGLPNYYWNNLRPMTQIMNINNGITEANNPENPFDDWNFVIITYATGDFHTGNSTFEYKDENGRRQILHFHGWKNLQKGLEKGKEFFPSPDQMLIAGDSAGAFAVPAVTAMILEDFYPECDNVTLLSDSGQLLYKNWRNTAEHVWKSPACVYEPIHTENITLDWYRNLYSIFGKRLRYLYAGSTRDYLLSAYYNDVVTHKYKTTPAVQERYFHQMQEMVRKLKELNPDFGIFVYRWQSLHLQVGGTVHTAVRHKRFYFRTAGGRSMAEWLGDAVHGIIYDVNMEFLFPASNHKM
ncbi:MAG: pectin acetylesterase-family hydrolase [Eubacteriales bacterium]|jgi:hypothetical protein